MYVGINGISYLYHLMEFVHRVCKSAKGQDAPTILKWLKEKGRPFFVIRVSISRHPPHLTHLHAGANSMRPTKAPIETNQVDGLLSKETSFPNVPPETMSLFLAESPFGRGIHF